MLASFFQRPYSCRRQKSPPPPASAAKVITVWDRRDRCNRFLRYPSFPPVNVTMVQRAPEHSAEEEMAHSSRNCKAVGGRIRTQCTRCGKVMFSQITPGTRKRIVRCSCGKPSVNQINNRRSVRQSFSARADAVLTKARETKIRVCDISSEGLGFLVPAAFNLSLHLGDEISIRYRAGGALSQRKVVVKNITGNRIGA